MQPIEVLPRPLTSVSPGLNNCLFDRLQLRCQWTRDVVADNSTETINMFFHCGAKLPRFPRCGRHGRE
jgi:hypothetical protein